MARRRADEHGDLQLNPGGIASSSAPQQGSQQGALETSTGQQEAKTATEPQEPKAPVSCAGEIILPGGQAAKEDVSQAEQEEKAATETAADQESMEDDHVWDDLV